jgi:hypothetical protein
VDRGESFATCDVLTDSERRKFSEGITGCMKLLKVLTKADGGQGGDGGWLVVCIDDDSMYDIAWPFI